MKQYKILLGLDQEDLEEIKKTGTYVIPEDVNEIAPYAFVGIKELVSISIPSSVSVIGDRAFAECPNLGKVVFKSVGVTMSDGMQSPFADCDSLDVIILDSKIKDKAYYEFKHNLRAMSPEEYKEYVKMMNAKEENVNNPEKDIIIE